MKYNPNFFKKKINCRLQMLNLDIGKITLETINHKYLQSFIDPLLK